MAATAKKEVAAQPDFLERHWLALTATAICTANALLTAWILWTVRHTLALQANDKVTLPEPHLSLPTPPANTLILHVGPGDLRLNGELITHESLRATLRKRPMPRLIIRAAPKVPYPEIKALLAEISAAGVQSVTFSVERE